MKEYKILSMDKAVIRKNSIRTEHLRNQLLSKPGTKLRLEAIQNVTMFHRAEKVAARVFAQHSAHVLVEGSLVNSTYEQPNGKGKKSKTTKITSWSNSRR